VLWGVVAGTAGCLGVLGDPAPRVLSRPQIKIQRGIVPELRRRDARSSPSLIRSATREISTAQFEGERAVLWTSFYTNCPTTVCPALIPSPAPSRGGSRRRGGYGDQAAFLPTTFDPERDTAETLREYAGQQGVDLDAGNWHFRPRPTSGPKRYTTSTSV